MASEPGKLEELLAAARAEAPDVAAIGQRLVAELGADLDERGRVILLHALAEQRVIMADAIRGVDVSRRQASVNARVAQVLSARLADGYSAWGAAVEEIATAVGRVALAVGRGALLGLVG